MNIQEAIQALNKIIDKARIHLYKPIQIAEILYQDRVNKNINLENIRLVATKKKRKLEAEYFKTNKKV